MRRKWIVGNWKMHGLKADALARISAISKSSKPASAEIVICPPFTLLETLQKPVAAASFKLGAQDCAGLESGAFTGDVSPVMLKDAGCEYVIIGHSERRQFHRESNDIIRIKMLAAMAAGLIPVICVGETEEERENGQYKDAVIRQLPKAAGNYLVAYEPVWAIGSGKVPTAEQIAEMHKLIAERLASAKPSGSLASGGSGVLYGGSVNAANAAAILSIIGVDGVLVGGASLKPEEFCAIIGAAT